jgi:hypothetical protein
MDSGTDSSGAPGRTPSFDATAEKSGPAEDTEYGEGSPRAPAGSDAFAGRGHEQSSPPSVKPTKEAWETAFRHIGPMVKIMAAYAERFKPNGAYSVSDITADDLDELILAGSR